MHAAPPREQIAPRLLAWLDSACVWQLQRRNGCDFELPPPEAAIPPEEDAVSIDAAIALRDSFAKESPAVRALFDALIALLTGEGRRHHQVYRPAIPCRNDRVRPLPVVRGLLSRRRLRPVSRYSGHRST